MTLMMIVTVIVMLLAFNAYDDLRGNPAAELTHVAIQLVPALHQGCLPKTTDKKEGFSKVFRIVQAKKDSLEF